MSYKNGNKHIRQMKIKNRPDYSFSDNLIVYTKDFDSSLLKTYKSSCKGVLSLYIYYIKYIPTKRSDLRSIDRSDNDESYLYLFFDNVNGYLEENDEIKYLDKSKEALKNYTKLWQETKRQIEVIDDDESIEYRKNFKIRFESDGDLPLGETFNIVHMIIAAASVLEKNRKSYLQVFFKWICL